MDNKNLQSIEEINAKFDEILEKEDEEEIEKEGEENEEEIVSKPDDNTEIAKEEVDEEPEQEKEIVETPSKQEFAFGELRKKNNDLKKELEEKESMAKYLEEIAASNGFKTSEDFIQAYEKQKIEKEADEKGVDPELLKEMNTLKASVSKLTKERETQTIESGLNKFRGVLDNIARENDLSEDEKKNLVNEMGKEGYTLED